MNGLPAALLRECGRLSRPDHDSYGSSMTDLKVDANVAAPVECAILIKNRFSL
jgi:chloramphenicol 3-O-phosphotransferase